MKIKVEDIKNIDKYNKKRNIKPEKRNKIKNKITKEQQLSLLGELLLIKSLDEYFNINYDDINIIYSKNGKPYIENKKLYYNISHTNQKVIVVLEEEEIGIDILENNKDQKKVQNLFSKEEQELLRTGKINTIELFCLKEAQIKCNGSSILHFKKTTLSPDYKYILIRGKDYTIAICKKKIAS